MEWHLKCPECGFEFCISFDADESEETKKILRECPCGAEMDIIEEKKDGE